MSSTTTVVSVICSGTVSFYHIDKAGRVGHIFKKGCFFDRDILSSSTLALSTALRRSVQPPFFKQLLRFEKISLFLRKTVVLGAREIR